MPCEVRIETLVDFDAVRQVHLAAFETRYEADIVDLLREDEDAFVPMLSRVASLQGEVIGHVISSRSPFPQVPIAMLGPIGVLPTRQRQGVGSALMRDSIEVARELGFAAIMLLGHPEYYPRFGFVPASRFHLRTAYEVPDEVVMVLPLQVPMLKGVSGLVEYPSAFVEAGLQV